MCTDKQRRANRRNALRATGPRTPEGKARSSQNALQHGLNSRHLVIPGDVYRQSYQPEDPVEESLIRQMVDAEWRLLRYSRAEAGIFWFRYNHATVPDPSEKPAPPATEGDRITYRLGRALQDLSSETDNLTPISRFQASARRSNFQALQSLEGRRQLHDKARVGLAPIPIEAETVSCLTAEPPAREKLRNETISESSPIKSIA
jgi:hypothetical protein